MTPREQRLLDACRYALGIFEFQVRKQMITPTEPALERLREALAEYPKKEEAPLPTPVSSPTEDT